MRILIGCEFSGVVRRAFRSRGHDAWSCDLLPAEDCSLHHIQDDVLLHLEDGWDLMIGFPPCTHLSSSGARWFVEKRADGRQQAAIAFFMSLANASIPRIAIENPVGIMSSEWRNPDQIIQPFHHGHPESKATCLWLKGLPKLKPTNVCEPIWWTNPDGTEFRDAKGKRYSPSHYLSGRNQKRLARWANQTASGQNKLAPSDDRWKLRSITYQGVADAMAEQWGNTEDVPKGCLL